MKSLYVVIPVYNYKNTIMIAIMVLEFGCKPRVLQFIQRSAAGFKAAKAAIVVPEK
jgi:hypothetical protein